MAWPRRTVAATKRTDIWDCGQGLAVSNHNAPWDEKVRPIRSFNFLRNKLEDL